MPGDPSTNPPPGGTGRLADVVGVDEAERAESQRILYDHAMRFWLPNARERRRDRS